MGQAKRRGTFEQRVEVAKRKAEAEAAIKLQAKRARFQQEQKAYDLMTEEQQILTRQRIQGFTADQIMLAQLFGIYGYGKGGF